MTQKIEIPGQTTGDPTATQLPGYGNGSDPNFCYECGADPHNIYSCLLVSDIVSDESGSEEEVNFRHECMLIDNWWNHVQGPMSPNLEGQCMVTQINDLNPDLINPKLDLTIAYTVRDSFLRKFSTGNKYYSYYYYLSKLAVDSSIVNISNWYQHQIFGVSTYSAINTFMYGAPTAIPFTTAYQTDALALIALWRTKTTRTFDHQLFNEITSDLAIYTGKTNAWLYANVH